MRTLLIPVQLFQPASGNFRFGRSISISSIHTVDELPGSQLAGDLRKMGVPAQFCTGQSSAKILIRRDRRLSRQDEYEIRIAEAQIEILAGNDAGAYYGVQTLRELIRLHGKALPCCRINDWPSLARRGVYHDCSRGKVPKVSTIKELVERLAHWKINEYQIYIEDVFTFKKHPLIGRDSSPFTPADILEIQEHCKKHHVNFVPSLSSFGHFERILMLSKYQKLGEMPGYRNFPGGTTLCPSDPGSIRLVSDLYSEFVPLFTAEDFNVCCDEPWELGQGRSKTTAERIGRGRVYLDFILKLRTLCLKHGKRMNMWGDIVMEHPELIPQLPKDIVLLNWDYYKEEKRMRRTNEFADAGLPFVCCPGVNDWQSHGTRLQTALTNISNFGKVAVQYGSEGILNTEWGDGGHRNTLGVALCAFAFGAANSWNPSSAKQGGFVEDFTFHVFGDKSGRLADALQILGAEESQYWSYHTTTELLSKQGIAGKPIALAHTVIDKNQLPREQVSARIENLEKLSWPKPEKDLSGFERIALEEFELAADMDRLAWQRYALAKEVRSGKIPAKRELQTHAAEFKAMSKEFSRLWLIRNRPSRLRENMDCFEAAYQEAIALAKK